MNGLLPETNVLLLLIGVVMGLIKIIEVMVKRRNGSNPNGVLGKTVAIYDHGDRAHVREMFGIIKEQKWDPKLEALLKMSDRSISIQKETLHAMHKMLDQQTKHFADFQCLAYDMKGKRRRNVTDED